MVFPSGVNEMELQTNYSGFHRDAARNDRTIQRSSSTKVAMELAGRLRIFYLCRGD
jgi:hypothetical protein